MESTVRWLKGNDPGSPSPLRSDACFISSLRYPTPAWNVPRGTPSGTGHAAGAGEPLCVESLCRAANYSAPPLQTQVCYLSVASSVILRPERSRLDTGHFL